MIVHMSDMPYARYRRTWIAAEYGIQVWRTTRLCSPCSGRFGLFGRGDSRVDLLAILPPDTGRGRTVAATLTRAYTHDYIECYVKAKNESPRKDTHHAIG